MKVKECINCQHCDRRTWVSSYKPANYHEVGVSHAYRYCKLHKMRCLEVKTCTFTKEMEVVRL